MKVFYVLLALLALWVYSLLNKPIPKQQQVARAFTATEIDYLEQSFYYAMDTLKEGEYLDWSAAAVNGRITVGKPYESGKKALCRPYVEVARTYDAQKVDNGIACKRVGKEGWCRVHGENPQSCALETEESTITKQARYTILRGTQILDEGVAKLMGIDAKGMVPNAPNVNVRGMPSIGQVPEFQTPDFEPRDFRPPMPWDPPQN